MITTCIRAILDYFTKIQKKMDQKQQIMHNQHH